MGTLGTPSPDPRPGWGAHSRGNLSASTGAGGRGTFNAYTRAAGLNGHHTINDPHLWTASLRTFREQLGR